jgi:glycylpeptide N-tetradecanoyltransferase
MTIGDIILLIVYDAKVTDMCSFYFLPSTVLKNPKHSHLNAVYSFYNVATSISFQDLMLANIILAKNANAGIVLSSCILYHYCVLCNIDQQLILFVSVLLMCVSLTDVFNCLNIMDNGTMLSELKFGMGDGDLQYYLYNWKCPNIEPADVGLVLL